MAHGDRKHKCAAQHAYDTAVNYTHAGAGSLPRSRRLGHKQRSSHAQQPMQSMTQMTQQHRKLYSGVRTRGATWKAMSIASAPNDT
jgi:hypothetical protein